MYNSRNIKDLRADVAANCEVWLDMCRAARLDVLVTGTVRDREYQEQCYRTGASRTPIPSFHAQGIGLAFDFCKNVKGQEYGDPDFFRRAGEIGEKIGFEWGGRWKSFPDRPHLQWSQGGKYTSSMIRSGKRPPVMPPYQKEDVMTQEQFNAMFKVAREAYEAEIAARPASGFAKASWDKAVIGGVFDGTKPVAALTREQEAVVLDRLGLLG